MSVEWQPPPPKFHFLKSATISYVAMALFGLAIMAFFHENISSSFQIEFDRSQWIVMAKCIAISVVFSFGLHYLFEGWFGSYRSLMDLMVDILGSTSFLGSIYLAFLSGFGEEILFRGAIQPFLGLWATSVLFGLVHLGPDAKPNAWSLAAGLMGVVLGYIYQQLEILWPVILAHMLINFISINKLRRLYRQRLQKGEET